jgi:uncharacterized membrane protein
VFDAEHVRDAAVTAAVFGVAGFAWLGWAQEAPPQSWRVWLGVGSIASLLVGVAGGLLAVRVWGPETALADSGAGRAFGLVAGAELVLCAVGGGLLALRGKSRWTSSWICFVVGLHFLPLAVVLEDAGLHLLGAVLMGVAALGITVSRRTSLHPSAVTGLGAGIALLLFAIRGVIAAL